MNHSGMIGSVVVMEPTEFDNWLSGNASQQSPAVAGQQLYRIARLCFVSRREW